MGLYNPNTVMTYDGLIEVCGTEIITNKLSKICANTYPWIQEFFFLIKQTSTDIYIHVHTHVDIYAIRLYSGSLQRSIYLHQPNNNY